MKKIIILIAIMFCMINARIFTYSTTVNGKKCFVKINPEKGRVETGKCKVTDIRFKDSYNMLIAAYDVEWEPLMYYYDQYFFEDRNDIKDIVKIYAEFDVEAEEKPKLDYKMAKKARMGHFHQADDGIGWSCDDGYIWADDGEHCIKDTGKNNNCPPSWQDSYGRCLKGWN